MFYLPVCYAQMDGTNHTENFWFQAEVVQRDERQYKYHHRWLFRIQLIR